MVDYFAGTALPPYARFVDDRRGAFKRFALLLMLRVTVKWRWRLDTDVAKLRENNAAFDARFAVVDPTVRRTPAGCADVAAEWIDVPESKPSRVLLYLHGGAFILRFPATHAGLAANLGHRIGARTLMVDYRLAPEHRYPAAADDCYAAYRWLLAAGIHPRDIVIAGDSAGANLALATLHRIKAAGEPMPACAILMSPFVDFTLSSRSMVYNERRDPIFTLAGGLMLRGMYASPEQSLDPSVSPLFGDFSGFPPLLFQAGSTEILLDESTRAAECAHAAGVPVELEIWRKMPHVFQVMHSLPQADAAIARIADFVTRHAGWRA